MTFPGVHTVHGEEIIYTWGHKKILYLSVHLCSLTIFSYFTVWGHQTHPLFERSSPDPTGPTVPELRDEQQFPAEKGRQNSHAAFSLHNLLALWQTFGWSNVLLKENQSQIPTQCIKQSQVNFQSWCPRELPLLFSASFLLTKDLPKAQFSDHRSKLFCPD